MNRIFFILLFLCGILIYIINYNIDGLSVDLNNSEICIYNQYVYSFHPDPIIRIEQIANRDWSSCLNFYPDYCNLKKGYGDDFYCDDYVGLTAGYIPCGGRIDIDNSYIYLTRLKLPDSIINIPSNYKYMGLGDCACDEFKDYVTGSTNMYGSQNSNLIDGNTRYCSSNNNIKIHGSIRINHGLFTCGKDWVINNINMEDVTTIFAPDGQFLTLPLVKKITHNCSCNFQTLEDANKLLNDTEYQIKYNTIDESCIICLEKIIVNTKIIRTKCNHHFHTECFEKYLVYNNFNKSGCPICRGELL